jgi:Tol biopolymer transport system component
VIPTDRSWIRRVALPLVVFLTVVTGYQLEAQAGTVQTRRVSVSSAGAEASGDSYDSSISANGRFVAFASTAPNLVAGDTNGYVDVFVHDRRTDTTRRVSLSSGGNQSNGDSDWTSISADGRFVAFESDASNLVPGDTNSHTDVFVHDRETGSTRRVSVSSDGSEGNGDSEYASISADGGLVAFSSAASNLVRGDSNGTNDIFVRDRTIRRTRRVSVSSAGSEGDGFSYSPSISADGRSVAYSSAATNLVPGDTNDDTDIFVRDRETARTRRVSVSSGGVEGNGNSGSPSLSADGRTVAFDSSASNLVGGDTNLSGDIFVRDREAGVTSRVSVSSVGTEGNGSSYAPTISARGRFVTFYSGAGNLVGTEDTNNYRDVFLHDRETGTTSRASVNSAGTIQGNGDCSRPAISADGRFIAFESDASSLIVGDTNGYLDIFLRGPLR